jgi:hypothetical protein
MNALPDAKSVIHAMNTDVIIPGGMTSYLHISVNNPFNDHFK